MLVPSKTQGKVSMVVPCYNKERDIPTMFDTILAQDWDNIELILVNDGSTDNTREIIAIYEPQFVARGYEAVIIDQENAGVCSAAKTGLARACGDYICMVDADDELDPAYVSTMAGWLDAHTSCDIAICSGINFRETDGGREFWHLPSKRLPTDDNEIAPEHFLMGEIIRQTVWVYLVRADYLRKCRIAETYHTSIRGSHEPGYVIPLLAYGGTIKYFPLPLYRFNGSGDGFSESNDMTHAQNYYDRYTELCDIAIDALPQNVADAPEKRFLKRVARLSAALRLYRLAAKMGAAANAEVGAGGAAAGAGTDGDAASAMGESYAVALLDEVNEDFAITPPLTREQIAGKEYQLTKAIGDSIFNHMTEADTQAFPGLDARKLWR
jgi:glycosyltransferase involved in cell wall biosynthesis